MRGCAGNGHSPGEIQDARRVGASRTEMTCAEDSGKTALCAWKEGTCCLILYGVGVVVALSGFMVYGLEGDCAGLR